ncbi:MAG TPA: hypothetical protein VEQ65_07580 [Opitutus sp.]|nr:hypothetical protein [Opitutus sp.]
MTLLPLRWFALLSGLMVAASVTSAEPAIIAKARARLGPEATLDAVKSIHYVGTLIAPDPAEAGKEVRQSIEIFLQKPARQRIVVTSPQTIEVSALDEYEAWRRTTDANDPTKWEQQQLSVDQIKQLRADVWQNLYFFRGIERAGGRVEDQGPVTIDGISCQKIAFFHSPTLVYYRCFDQATGALVFTGDERNNVREEGEVIAGGIRFPKTIVISQLANGQTTVRRIVFEKITVNEEFPSSLFAVPLPTLK